ncbi:MAG: protein translocase subunit SecD [Gammaproteobacteria bacterium]|nr:protein translocase subunit SecD [Gammaproteobacteria bacterium]
MHNQYPWWKNLLIVIIVAAGTLYAVPNLYGEDPALQISASHGGGLNAAAVDDIRARLKQMGITPKSIESEPRGLIVRFANTEDQFLARDNLNQDLAGDYVIALNLVPATPGWLGAIRAKPMYLGLDLRGGVHFLLDVDTEAAIGLAEERYVEEFRVLLRDKKTRYLTIGRSSRGLELKFREAAERDKALELLKTQYRNLILATEDSDGTYYVTGQISEQEKRETRKFAVQQNVTTLRNRVNELGVAEPVIQQQGESRIVVQLPGVQDTARAKEILGATATLEFRMADDTHTVQDALQGRVPAGARLYKERNGQPVLLKNRIIITGDAIIDASSGIDQRDGSAAVFISLDGKGANKMYDTTKENVGKLMAVVFIETKIDTQTIDGQQVKTKRKVEEVISLAQIREPFSKRFQITGLDNPEEARDLALLLRAGALSAPIEIIEERTVGPSLGAENIAKGFNSTLIGFAVIALFMAIYYRFFGVLAGISLFVNIVCLIAILSLLQATLTLPGIAGIALTVGMAIDSNVLIFERIRDEMRAGSSPQAAIYAGYDRAWNTIFDSNVTIFIAGLALFLLGSGPVRGFAVVLCIGILTSMFSAVLVSRALVNVIYGQRKLTKLKI